MPSNNDEEKRELLKLKQGLIEESDIIETDVHEQPEKLKGLARFENFVYHNKWYIVVAVFFIVVGGFMLFQLLSKEAADMRVLLVTSDAKQTPDLYRKVNDIELALESYCPDFDHNGNVHVEVYYIDLTKQTGDTYYVTTNTAKFFGELDTGVAQMLICDSGISNDQELSDSENLEKFDSFFVDLGEITGDADLSGKTTIKLKDTPLAAAANYENSVPEVLVIGVKNERPDMISYNESSLERNTQAREVLVNILNDNKVGKTDGQS